MKRLFKIIIVILSLLCLCGCGEKWKLRQLSENDYVIGSMKAYVYTFDLRQVDSMCVADGLPRNIETWTTTTYNDYETNKKVSKKMYIKELTEKNELIYLLSEDKEKMYKVIKRYVNVE